MKIAYTTTTEALNILNWSGTNYHIAQALIQQGASIDYIEKLKKKRDISLLLKKLWYMGMGKHFSLEVEYRVAGYYAQQVKAKIKKDTDIIFSPSTIPLAYLDTNKPKVFYVDTLFDGFINTYKKEINISAETIKHAGELEQAALTTSSLALFSSDWAAQNAIRTYHVDPAKVKVVPMGANIECNRQTEDIKALINQKLTKECNLLFIGVDWKRKGGAKAIEIARKLNEYGLKTTLHVVGADGLSDSLLPDFVVNHGFIAKSNAAGIKKIDKLFSECHFFILPTTAEAYGIVFCEACSFGVPCVATNVGGIPTIIKDNINGKTFDVESGTDEYANYIYKLHTNKTEYSELCLSSFHEYKNRLNWQVAGKNIMSLLNQL